MSIQALGEQIREHFPIFSANGSGKRLAYLDTAASSQKPRVVIDRISRYLSEQHANIHRGAYRLSIEATRLYEEARELVACYIGAPSPVNVIFTRGTTEGVNLVARSLERWFEPGDTILLTTIEHHSNIVPWQLLAERRGLRVEFAAIDDDASLNWNDFRERLARSKPKLVAATQLSNAFGTVNPAGDICDAAHAVGAKVLIDAAQSVPHTPLDVRQIGADFLVFSGHKLYGPTGIGALFASSEMLEHMEPFLGGGDMIERVTTEGSTWAQPPQKFEAGTPPIAEAIGLGAAIRFLGNIGVAAVQEYEHKLFGEAWERLRKENGVELYGPATTGKPQSSIISFNLKGVHSHDLSTVADDFNVQLRSGHHCAMPALRRLNLQSTARVSLGVYSSMEDIEQLCEAVRFAGKLFR